MSDSPNTMSALASEKFCRGSAVVLQYATELTCNFIEQCPIASKSEVEIIGRHPESVALSSIYGSTVSALSELTKQPPQPSERMRESARLEIAEVCPLLHDLDLHDTESTRLPIALRG